MTQIVIYLNFLFFRRISPKQGNFASQSLSEEANAINTRKLLVNAQVKAMVSLVEMISNAGYVLIIYFTVKTSYITLIQIMMLYMVVLPYAFLMNTDFNKNRIVEHGWINILKNIIGKPNNSIFIDSNESLDEKIASNNKSKGENKAKNIITTKIFVTESSGDPFAATHINDDDKPSTSMEYSNRIKVPTYQHFVEEMLDKIDHEDEYLEVFQCFVKFIDHCKEGNDPKKFQLCGPNNHKPSLHVSRNIKTPKGKSSNSKSKKQKNKGKSIIIDKNYNLNSSSHDERTFKGNKEERTTLRRDILIEMRANNENTNSLKYTGEKLIDQEENFIS